MGGVQISRKVSLVVVECRVYIRKCRCVTGEKCVKIGMKGRYLGGPRGRDEAINILMTEFLSAVLYGYLLIGAIIHFSLGLFNQTKMWHGEYADNERDHFMHLTYQDIGRAILLPFHHILGWPIAIYDLQQSRQQRGQ